ncbi:hypothetical protein [uncultured Secundilactobacillus sp.]|nr:hypothetical protein [uncultured Secundilactobacillus sp.]
MEISVEAAMQFDAKLPPMTKKWQPSQEEFNIISRTTVTEPAN